MAVCAGIKRSGGCCTLSVEPGKSYCHHHDPDRSEERKKAASRAGKSKPSREIRDLKKQLEDLAADVRAGRVERGTAVVVNQILNTRARLIELERRVEEAEREPDRIAEQAYEVLLSALEERLPREEFEHAVHALAGMDSRGW
jgi:hypothetical protein